MLRIKRLYTFIYQTFVPVFIMTFGITLFIFIIQFLWQQIEKLVGKGLETSVLLELFFYATLNLVPMALPLAILLASLMTFGNMGERLELLAIKASGVSLLKIMRPMIVLIVAMTIGCFFYQNDLAPKFKVKVYSLLYAIKQKSPEFDIPEGAFYNELSGYSIYVKDKNLETKMLHGVVIYETGGGGPKNMSVTVCDSAYLEFVDSIKHMRITMYNGQRFQNMKNEVGRRTNTSSSNNGEFIPYMRENFTKKIVNVPFKDDFERIEESRYDDTHISKNLKQLALSVDSMEVTLDSLNLIDRKNVQAQSYTAHRRSESYTDSLTKLKESPIVSEVKSPLVFKFDSIYDTFSKSQKAEILSMASSEAKGTSGSHLMYYHIDTPKPVLQKRIRDHEISWHRMFTLPFACLVFFFIGAPLGSIIRKGGLGVPVIISVLLFIVYYIIDNIGYKMARDGVWTAWQGMWLSAAVLFPLGVFLTYKSTKESALFSPEKYKHFLRKILFIEEKKVEPVKMETISITLPKVEELTNDTKLITDFRALDIPSLVDMATNYEEYGHEQVMGTLAIVVLREKGYDVAKFLHDGDIEIMEYDAVQFDFTSYWSIGFYFVSLVQLILPELSIDGLRNVQEIISQLSVVGFAPFIYMFIRALSLYVDFYSREKKRRNKFMHYFSHTLILILTFVLYPLMFLYIRRDMLKRLKRRVETSFTFN